MARRNWNGDDVRKAERLGKVAAALTGADITLIGLTPGGAGTNACVDSLAAATGGSVQAIGASSETITEWRNVCVRIPLRASTRMIATSELDAPVAIFRVYCSWPGASATMNERFAVAK